MAATSVKPFAPGNRKSEAFWQEYRAETELAHPDLTDFFLLSEMDLKHKYFRSAFERSGRTHMARNALIVLANTKDPSHLSLIRLAAQDHNPLIRATAVWALLKLGDLQMAAKLLKDPSELVRREAQKACDYLAWVPL